MAEGSWAWSSIARNDRDFGGGGPGVVIEFGQSPELDETALLGVEIHRFFLAAFREGSLFHRLAKALVIIAQIKLVVLDGAVDLAILARSPAEALDGGGGDQFDDDFVGAGRILVRPLSMPEGGGIAVHGIGAMTVLGGRFLAVGPDEIGRASCRER